MYLLPPLFILAFINFVKENPGFAAWMIAVLGSLLGTMAGVYYALIYKRLGTLEVRVGEVEVDMSDVKGELREYKEHVGAGDKALVQLALRVERHMTEEEDQVWSGVRGLADKLAEIQVENAEAHAKIVTEYGNRLSTIEAQLGAVRRGLPNGDIQEILLLLKKLVPV